MAFPFTSPQQSTSRATPPISLGGIDISQDAEGRFSLNDLHRAAVASGVAKDIRPNEWLSLQQTEELSKVLITENPAVAPVASKAGRYGGTFVVRELVYSYAMWVSPSFHLKVIRIFDAVMTGGAAHSNPPELSVDPAILTRTFGQLIKLGQLGGLDLDQARLAADRETFKRLGVSPLAILDIRAPANQPTYTIVEEVPGLAVLCASKLLQQHGERWTAADLHRALEQVGYLERRTLELVDKPARRYPVLIGDGLHYGANVKYSDRSLTTAPAYYVERFADLLDHLDPVLQEAAEHEAGALAGSSSRNMSHRQRQLYKASGLQAERRAEKRQRQQDIKRQLVVEAARSGQCWADVFRSLNLRRYFEPAELDELRALFHAKPNPAPAFPATLEKTEHPGWSRPADLVDPADRAELQARNRFQPVTREQAREFLLEEAERFLVEGEDWTTFCYMRGRLFPMAFSDAEILSLHQAYERAFPTGLPLNWGGLIH